MEIETNIQLAKNNMARGYNIEMQLHAMRLCIKLYVVFIVFFYLLYYLSVI